MCEYKGSKIEYSIYGMINNNGYKQKRLGRSTFFNSDLSSTHPCLDIYVMFFFRAHTLKSLELYNSFMNKADHNQLIVACSKSTDNNII